MKTINIHETVYHLVKENPALRECLIQLGFTPLSNDVTFNLLARKITLAKAISKHHISLETLNQALFSIGLEGVERIYE